MEQLPQGRELDRQDLDQHSEILEQQHSPQQSQQQNTQQKQRSVAILDGPGLAYYIGRQYREDNLTNIPTELLPAYSEIGERAIQFLEDMDAVGLRV
jgi:hypothetical protein